MPRALSTNSVAASASFVVILFDRIISRITSVDGVDDRSCFMTAFSPLAKDSSNGMAFSTMSDFDTSDVSVFIFALLAL